jgi:hypothetical protein
MFFPAFFNLRSSRFLENSISNDSHSFRNLHSLLCISSGGVPSLFEYSCNLSEHIDICFLVGKCAFSTTRHRLHLFQNASTLGD